MRKERVETGCVIDRIAKLIKLERGVDARESRSIRCNVSSHKRANLGWPVIGLEYLNRIDDIRTLIREAIEVAKGLNNEERAITGWINGRKPIIQFLTGSGKILFTQSLDLSQRVVMQAGSEQNKRADNKKGNGA